MKFIRTLKASDNELFQIGWSLNFDYDVDPDNGGDILPYAWVNDKAINPTAKTVDKQTLKQMNDEIDRIEEWFLKEGYKQFFTSVNAEGHDDYGVGGSALVTQDQLDELNEEGWRTSAGTFPGLPFDIMSNLYVSLTPYDFDSPIKFGDR